MFRTLVCLFLTAQLPLSGCDDAQNLCPVEQVQSYYDFTDSHLRNVGDRCYEELNRFECKECPSGSECLDGYLSGVYLDIGVGSWGTTSPSTICTIPCSDDSDCTGLTFTSYGETMTSIEWECVTNGPSGAFCGVVTDYTSGGSSDLCSGCGGNFCSGNCIGCPQC